MGQSVNLIYGCPLSESLIHDELPLRCGLPEQAHELGQRPLVEFLGKSQAIAAVLQRAYGLLKCLFVGLAYAHDLPYSLHLGAQFVLHPFELLKAPAGELDHHIVPGGGVPVQGSIPPVRNLIQCQAAGQLGGDEGDGKSGGLGGQG